MTLEPDWPAHYAAVAAEAEADAQADYWQRPQRTPLTTNQHILHLLLTVFTGGLWLPVWIILGIRGNRR
jgi:hypothetical protein